MRTKTTILLGVLTLSAVTAVFWLNRSIGQENRKKTLEVKFYQSRQHLEWPPMTKLPDSSLPVVHLGGNLYAVEDRFWKYPPAVEQEISDQAHSRAIITLNTNFYVQNPKELEIGIRQYSWAASNGTDRVISARFRAALQKLQDDIREGRIKE